MISYPPDKPSNAVPIPPMGTVSLVLVTLGVSLAQSIADHGQWITAIGVVPARVLQFTSLFRYSEGQIIPGGLTLLAHVFLHGGWWHVLPNMAGLWIFGALAEPVMGTGRFLLIYFTSAVIGAFGIGLVLPQSMTPIAGASMAISGILGAYCALIWANSPHSRGMRLLVRVFDLASVLTVTTWLAFRTVPLTIDLVCSVMYHFLPFLTMWLGVRVWEISKSHRRAKAYLPSLRS